MSFNTKLVVVGFTLALIAASYGVAALCEEKTGIACTSDATCESFCLQKKGPADIRYIGGYCSSLHVADDLSPSCVCRKTCGGAPQPVARAAGDESLAEKPATAGRRGMGNLN